ncbi:MAG: DUF4870 domain-containing protein [Gemmatimonadota bacterium]
MTDQNPPPSTPPPPPGPEEERPVGQPTSTGLDPQLASLLCYILSPLTGIVFFLIEKANSVVRFHAAQSIVFGVAAIILWIAIAILSYLFYQIAWSLGSLFTLLQTLVGIGLFVLWVVLLIKGYSGQRWKLPVIGDMAERLAASQAGAQ